MDNGEDHTRIDLLRHGEHVLGDAICGLSDPELSDKGWAQLQNQCDGLVRRGDSWDICISSPRSRCIDFADRFCQQQGISLLVEDGFSEIHFGRWEGLSFTEISQSYPGQWQHWIENPDSEAPHGGEKYGDFLIRINNNWLELLQQHRGKRVLLISHGGVMRAIFSSIFDLEPEALFRFKVPHACHSRISTYHMKDESNWFQLDQHNSEF